MHSILLTSITTFIGLAPLLLETSKQGRHLIPAAISMAYGILFATAITLLLIPALIRFSHNIHVVLTKLRTNSSHQPKRSAHE